MVCELYLSKKLYEVKKHIKDSEYIKLFVLKPNSWKTWNCNRT